MLRSWIIVGLTIAIPRSGAGQIIPDDLSCRACSIDIEIRSTLGTAEGPAALSSIGRVATDARGRYWVFGEASMPLLFDKDGVFLRRLGTRGAGPGEFEWPYAVWSVGGDSVLVADGTRLHVLGPDLQFARTVAIRLLGVQGMVAVDWPDNVVAHALDPAPARFGIPFHVVSFADESPVVKDSFGGSDEPLTQSSVYSRTMHVISRSPSGGYWTIALGRYEITRWSDSHEPLLRLERRPSWFPGQSDMLDGGPDKAPSPRCLGVSEDEDGLLWSYCLVPGPDYQRAWDRVADAMRTPGIGEIPAREIDWHRLHHTRVEVIDPQSRRVVARRTIGHSVTSVLPGRRAALVIYSPDGVPVVRILELPLRGARVE